MLNGSCQLWHILDVEKKIEKRERWPGKDKTNWKAKLCVESFRFQLQIAFMHWFIRIKEVWCNCNQTKKQVRDLWKRCCDGARIHNPGYLEGEKKTCEGWKGSLHASHTLTRHAQRCSNVIPNTYLYPPSLGEDWEREQTDELMEKREEWKQENRRGKEEESTRNENY